MHFIKENNIPDDYEIMVNEWSDGDYDYGWNSYTFAGAFSMQDHNVGGHDPFSMMALGWVDPYVPTESSTITLQPFESSGDVILLSPNFSI